ncbi:MAG: helix-turn-helix domain-containing protein [Phycisphaerales bacterium]
MAKMFYTLEEAATKLGMTEAEVQSLAESGQLQEFRDRDRLMFKVEQVDLLAGDADGDDGDEDITLADTSGGIEPISLSSTGSASSVSLESSGESTGVSIFEPDDGDEVDANADTLVSNDALGGSGFNMDAGASGSGLAQLAFEPDDTSLGGNLLDDLAGDSNAGGSMGGGSAIGGSALGGSVSGALFEGGTETESEFARSPAMMPMGGGEVYDGPASGLFGGAALGMVLLLLLAMGVMVLGMTGGSQQVLSGIDTNTLYMIAGGGAGVVIIFAIVGWAMLRRS